MLIPRRRVCVWRLIQLLTIDFYKQKKGGGRKERHLSQKLEKGKSSSCPVILSCRSAMNCPWLHGGASLHSVPREGCRLCLLQIKLVRSSLVAVGAEPQFNLFMRLPSSSLPFRSRLYWTLLSQLVAEPCCSLDYCSQCWKVNIVFNTVVATRVVLRLPWPCSMLSSWLRGRFLSELCQH